MQETELIEAIRGAAPETIEAARKSLLLDISHGRVGCHLYANAVKLVDPITIVALGERTYWSGSGRAGTARWTYLWVIRKGAVQSREFAWRSEHHDSLDRFENRAVQLGEVVIEDETEVTIRVTLPNDRRSEPWVEVFTFAKDVKAVA